MHWISRRSLVASALAAVVAIACGGDGGDATGSTCPTDSTLTYETFGKSFFDTNCLRCHSSSTKRESPLFDTVEQIRANKSVIDKNAAGGPNAVNDDMPEDRSVAESDRRKLGEWLACGAP